jgi:hypothetical protein
VKAVINDKGRVLRPAEFDDFVLNYKNLCGSFQGTIGELKANLKTLSETLKASPDFQIKSVTPKFPWNYSMKSETDERYILAGYIIEYAFQNNYKLYVLNYNLDVVRTRGNPSWRVTNKYAPIILVGPEEPNVMKYGLYRSYIPTGAYTCKILEYIFGSSVPLIKLGESDGLRLFGHYQYVGDRYDGLYPYYIDAGAVAAVPVAGPVAGGGGRRTPGKLATPNRPGARRDHSLGVKTSPFDESAFHFKY